MNVLVIEDDRRTAEFILKGLKEHGFTVDHTVDGADGLHLATTRPYDVLVVDRMVPGLEGLAVIQALRAAKVHTPAIVLSSLGQVDHRIEGLKAGSDDYLAKPFVFGELLARIDAILRRKGGKGETIKLRVADLTMDLLSRRVERAGRVVDLLPREFQILECLMRNVGRVVTRTMLLETVWNYHFDPNTNVIDTQISRVRQKVDKDFAEPLIHTMRGAGYMIRAPERPR
jgi:two-component system, OmpR family, response regulator